MKEYPSIESFGMVPRGVATIAFRKYDGSNLRVEWNKKRGWYKWGTRKRLFDKSDPDYGPAITIFEKKYADPLSKILTDNKELRGTIGTIVFMEFFGPHSFAGWHDLQALSSIGINVEGNEPKDVVVFDINIHKKGLLGPRSFLKFFGHLDVAEVLYDGILTEEFIKDVREGKYPVREGVVCKGGDGYNHTLWMCKIKTLSYIEELKTRFGVGWSKYE
jgi:hypothetical protein